MTLCPRLASSMGRPPAAAEEVRGRNIALSQGLIRKGCQVHS